jgi:hypothetical protein
MRGGGTKRGRDSRRVEWANRSGGVRRVGFARRIGGPIGLGAGRWWSDFRGFGPGVIDRFGSGLAGGTRTVECVRRSLAYRWRRHRAGNLAHFRSGSHFVVGRRCGGLHNARVYGRPTGFL